MTGRHPNQVRALVLTAVMVLSVLAVPFGLVGAANQSTGDSPTWPQNQYDDARTGHTDAVSGPTGPVESLWSVELTADSNPYTVSPVLANGTVFIGSDDGNVSAYDATNGTHLWTNQVTGFTKNDVTSLTLADGVLYVSGIEYVFALDPATGATVWSSPFSLAADSVESYAQLVVKGGRLYVAGMNASSFDAGYVYALNATTGTQDWRFVTNRLIWEGGVTLANGTVYVGDGGSSSFSGDGELYAVNATTGTLQWSKFYSGVRVRAAPTVANDTVFVAKENGDLVAYDEDTGNERWNTTVSFGVDVIESPAVADGVVYVGTKDTSEVWAYNASTGATVWSGPFDTGGTVASPVVVDGVLYVASSGDLYGIYPSNGTERFVHAYGVGESTPAVVNGTVYIHDGSTPGTLHAIGDVTQPASFDVSIVNTSSPTEEGTTLVVEADIANNGDETATQTIDLLIDNAVKDNSSVTLNASENTTVSLEWDTVAGDAGDYNATVTSENDTDTVSVTISAPASPANFSITNTATNSPVDEGGTLTVNATIENTGGVSGTQTVNLSVNGTVRDSISVTLAPGENTTVTLSWATSDGDAGDYTVNATSDNDSASVAVTVDSTSTGSSSGGSSSGGTGDTTTPTPTPTPTATSTPAPTTSPTPDPTPTAGATSTATPAPTATATAEPTPSPTPTQTPGQPGFGLAVALLAVALFGLTRRRRN